MTHREQFNEFWEIYPKRNGKKVGRDFCELWFKAEKPDNERFGKMMYFLKTDIANREYCRKRNKFYAAPQDPKVFLKNWSPGDEIEPLVKTRKDPVCANCGGKWTNKKGNTHCCSDPKCKQILFG